MMLSKKLLGERLHTGLKNRLLTVRWRRQVREIIGTIDLAQFAHYQNKHAGDHKNKYFDLRLWIAKTVNQLSELNLLNSSPQRILDLGTGACYFPYVCRHYGHCVKALDVRYPLYDDLAGLLCIDRRTWEIKAFEKLPPFDMRFDLVTAFRIVFNKQDTPDVWGVAEWDFFLRDIAHNCLDENGSVFLLFNQDIRTGKHYDEQLLRYFLQHGAQEDSGKIRFPSVGHFRR